MSRSRRSLLGLCATSLSVVGSGCSGTDGPGQTSSPSPSPSPSSSSPSPSPTTECEEIELPRPTPTGEGLEPLSYPEYPEPLTAETVREFVVEFERAYQHNRFLAEGFIRGTDLVLVDAGVPDGFVIEDDGDLLVGVNATIATEDNRVPEENGTDTPTQAPSYDDEFAAWYHLTPRRVRRTGAGTDLPGTPEDVDLSDAITCAASERRWGIGCAVDRPILVSGRHPGPA